MSPEDYRLTANEHVRRMLRNAGWTMTPDGNLHAPLISAEPPEMPTLPPIPDELAGMTRMSDQGSILLSMHATATRFEEREHWSLRIGVDPAIPDGRIFVLGAGGNGAVVNLSIPDELARSFQGFMARAYEVSGEAPEFDGPEPEPESADLLARIDALTEEQVAERAMLDADVARWLPPAGPTRDGDADATADLTEDFYWEGAERYADYSGPYRRYYPLTDPEPERADGPRAEFRELAEDEHSFGHHYIDETHGHSTAQFTGFLNAPLPNDAIQAERDAWSFLGVEGGRRSWGATPMTLLMHNPLIAAQNAALEHALHAEWDRRMAEAFLPVDRLAPDAPPTPTRDELLASIRAAGDQVIGAGFSVDFTRSPLESVPQRRRREPRGWPER